jgi:hypothetical protein
MKPCLSGSESGAEVLCYAKVCKTPPRVNEGLSFSREIATTEVKGWITKNLVPKGETPKRTDASSTIPSDNPLGII